MAVPGTVPLMPNQNSRSTTSESVCLRQSRGMAMSGGLVPYSPGGRLPKAVARELQLSGSRAMIEAAQVQAISYVAQRGMQAVADITDYEGRLITQTPLAEPRLKLVADTASGAIAAVVARMVW